MLKRIPTFNEKINYNNIIITYKKLFLNNYVLLCIHYVSKYKNQNKP